MHIIKIPAFSNSDVSICENFIELNHVKIYNMRLKMLTFSTNLV